VYKSIHLGNFKAFAETQKIPIKPLTLIFGPNSAGKSSFIHGLLFAHDAHTNDETDNLDVRRPRLGGDSVDLGGFRQFVHRRDVSNQVEWGVEIDTSSLEGRLGELLRPAGKITITLQIGLSVIKEKSRVTVQSYEIKTDDNSLLRASIKKKAKSVFMGLDELDDEAPIIRETVKAIIESATTTDKFKEDDSNTIQEAINTLVPTLVLDMGNFLPKGIISTDKTYKQDALFPISKGNRKEDLTQALEFYLPRTLNDIVKGLSEYVGIHLRKLHYLGPLRSYPARHIAFTQDHDANWHSGGGYAWDLVRNDPEIRAKVNLWLGSPDRMKTPYTLQVQKLISPDANYDVLWDALDNIFTELYESCPDDIDDYTKEDQETLKEIAEVQGSEDYDVLNKWDPDAFVSMIQSSLLSEEIEGINYLILVDKRTNTVVSHRDVGIGVSQVLPVLVSAYSFNDEVIAMEQPELHLHPALQAELGDVFIESAIERKNTFILETHSEHLILRLLRRIRETTDGELSQGLSPLTPDDICILYIKPSQKGSEIIKIPVTEDGEFKEKWPDGFFAERAEELF
jgi:hypothetical protein